MLVYFNYIIDNISIFCALTYYIYVGKNNEVLNILKYLKYFNLASYIYQI